MSWFIQMPKFSSQSKFRIEKKGDGNQIQITDELLNLHRFGDSPFSDLPIIISIVNFGGKSGWNMWSYLDENESYVDGKDINLIQVKWNAEDVSYYHEFSNAQVVAKFSVKISFSHYRTVNTKWIKWILTQLKQIFIFVRKLIDLRIVREEQTKTGLQYYPIEIHGYRLGANIARKAAIEYDEFLTDKENGI